MKEGRRRRRIVRKMRRISGGIREVVGFMDGVRRAEMLPSRRDCAPGATACVGSGKD